MGILNLSPFRRFTSSIPMVSILRLYYYFSLTTLIFALSSLLPLIAQNQEASKIEDAKAIEIWKEIRKKPNSLSRCREILKLSYDGNGIVLSNRLKIEIRKKLLEDVDDYKSDTIFDNAYFGLSNIYEDVSMFDSSLYYIGQYGEKLKKKPKDRFEFAFLNNKARLNFKLGNSDKAVNILREAFNLNISRESILHSYHIAIRNTLTPIVIQNKRYIYFLDSCIRKYIKKSIEYKDVSNEGIATMLLAECYKLRGDKLMYGEFYAKGLKIVESSTKDKMLPPILYFDAATKFEDFNNHILAIEYYKRYIEATWKTVDNDPKSSKVNQGFITDMVNAELNMSSLYEKEQKLDSSVIHAKKALDLCFLQSDSHKFTDITRFHIARFLLKLYKAKEALPYAEQALAAETDDIKKNPSKKLNYIYVAMLGQIHEALGRNDDQKKYFIEASDLYNVLKVHKLESEYPHVLVREVEILRFFIRSGLKFFQYEDIERNMNRILEINEYLTKTKLASVQSDALMKYDYESNKKLNQSLKIQNELKEKEANTQRHLAIVFFTGLCVAGGLGLITYRKTKETQKANKVLTEKNELISSQKVQLENAYEELNTTMEQVSQQSKEINEKNVKIADSINYASKIQNAFLPSPESLELIFPQSYLFFAPRDIVSGDFYWLRKVDDLIFLIVADCTGHGVPGAFMSLVASNAVFQVIVEMKIKNPAEALSAIDLRIRTALRQDQAGASKDGMDLALCVMPQDRSWMDYAGAGRPIFILRDNEIEELNPDKFPVGGAQHENKIFNTIRFNLQTKDRIYLFTDGITDQFGGPNKRKFTPKRLKNFIMENKGLSMKEQGESFNQKFYAWKNESNTRALDDATLFAFEI